MANPSIFPLSMANKLRAEISILTPVSSRIKLFTTMLVRSSSLPPPKSLGAVILNCLTNKPLHKGSLGSPLYPFGN